MVGLKRDRESSCWGCSEEERKGKKKGAADQEERIFIGELEVLD